MNKPKDNPNKKLDEVLSRFLSNKSDKNTSEDAGADKAAHYDDIDVSADKNAKKKS